MPKPRKDNMGDDAMVGIVWYYGLEDEVIKWKDYKEGDEPPYFYSDYCDYLEMVWMYLVLCFGDYGTSPRSGWIEDFDGYNKWFDELEKLMEPI